MSFLLLGNSLLKNLSWPIKSKKRERSGSGGSWDLHKNKKTPHRKHPGQFLEENVYSVSI
jgi:hypothetical protein